MNEKQQYEKHLAEKLEKLTQPGDASQHWPQMKALLNREMPEEGAGKKRPGPWWIFGIIAGILLTGSLAGNFFFSKNRKDTLTDTLRATTTNNKGETNTESIGSLPETKNENFIEKDKTSKPIASTISVPDEHTTKAILNNSNNIESITTEDKTKKSLAANTDKKETTTVPSSSTIAEKENLKNPIPSKALATNSGTPSKNELKLIRKREAERSDVKFKENLPIKYTASKEKPEKSNEQVVYTTGSKGTSIIKKEIKNTRIEKNLSEVNTTEETIKFSLVKQAIANSTESNISPSSIIKDSLNSNYTAQLTTVPYKAIVPTRFKSNTDRVKRLKNRVVGTGDSKNFVLGLSLPLAFPLSDQKVVAYNFTGGSNTALDYLPVPHLQYHINQKSYVQAEIQFASPQYIQPALVSQNKFEIPGTASNFRYITNSVYARKLFYFNLPIGVHYSPFKNFYLGTGMQFSSLLSGIAMHEQRGYNSLGPSSRDTLIYQNFNKFKSDSISGSLNGNEFRLMMDANYYWHRFTVGLRYNQALSNYISIRVSNSSPLFTDKNKSMQFYLRYNLWEDKKRKKSSLMANR